VKDRRTVLLVGRSAASFMLRRMGTVIVRPGLRGSIPPPEGDDTLVVTLVSGGPVFVGDGSSSSGQSARLSSGQSVSGVAGAVSVLNAGLSDATVTYTASSAKADRSELSVNVMDFGAGGTGAGDDTAAFLAAIAALPLGGELFVPKGKYVVSLTITGVANLTVTGEGAGTVLHNTTAATHTLAFVDCNQLSVRDLTVQGVAGTMDGLHLENCQRAQLRGVLCQGSGRHGIYAQRCFGIMVDACAVGIDVTSPYPSGVTNCQSGLVLTWDGVATDSGCNQFVVNGGWYVVGKSQSWAVQIERADGGSIVGPIAELSGGGILVKDSRQVAVVGYYGEANPSDVEYATGTATVTSGSTAVTGAGTAWLTNNAQGRPNAEKNKFLIVGTTAAKIASDAGSNTALTLAAPWPGSTAAGTAYRIQGVDLSIDGSEDVSILMGRGGGAVVLINSRRVRAMGLVTESLFLDANTTDCVLEVTTNRASASASRVVDGGSRNVVTQRNYQSDSEVQDQTARTNKAQTFSAAQTYTGGQAFSGQALASVVLSGLASGDAANRFALRNNGSIEVGDGAAARDTLLSRLQAGVWNVQNSLQFPSSRTAVSTPNSTLFVDSADNKLKFKDSAGTVNLLY
jgi:hypothetical protein